MEKSVKFDSTTIWKHWIIADSVLHEVNLMLETLITVVVSRTIEIVPYLHFGMLTIAKHKSFTFPNRREFDAFHLSFLTWTETDFSYLYKLYVVSFEQVFYEKEQMNSLAHSKQFNAE